MHCLDHVQQGTLRTVACGLGRERQAVHFLDRVQQGTLQDALHCLDRVQQGFLHGSLSSIFFALVWILPGFFRGGLGNRKREKK